jgi:hypothetical protein
METLRFAYLHEGYHPDVLARWESEGCLDEVRRRLGHRLVVRAVEAPAELSPGARLRVRIELENLGYAPPYTTRRLRVVLRSGDASHTLEPATATGADSRTWAPGATHTLELTATLPAEISPGTWEVRLLLLEDLGDTPAYALLFANDERVRDDTRRENVLASLTVAP